MINFNDYHEGERQPLGDHKKFGGCRQGHCLELQRLTGQKRCAYCGVDLTHDYYTWLLMCLDHVVPKQQAKELGIQPDLYDDFINLVLCCSGCNGFDNHYKVPPEIAVPKPQDEWTEEEFYNLRDRVYADKYMMIAKRREEEMKFYDGSPWDRQD